MPLFSAGAAGIGAKGTNGDVLIADSASPMGVKWKPLSAGSLTLIGSASMGGKTQHIFTGLGSYKALKFVVRGVYGTGTNPLRISVNAGPGADYSQAIISTIAAATYGTKTSIEVPTTTAWNYYMSADGDIWDYTVGGTVHNIRVWSQMGSGAGTGYHIFGQTGGANDPISSLYFTKSDGCDGGTITLYGVS